MCVFNNIGYSHDADKAYFNILEKGSAVEITAEFPWSIRNALLQFSPELNNAKTKDEFENALFNYIKLNLRMFDTHNRPMLLLSVKAINDEDHAHQGKYKLIFKGNYISKISNSILFNINNNQENYHRILLDNSTFKYTTTKDVRLFEIVGRPNKSLSFYQWGIILAGLGLIVYLFKLKRSFKFNI